MPGLVPGIHVFVGRGTTKTWMAGTSPAMARPHRSIERQGCAVLVVAHAREIISRIHVSRSTEEELLEGFGSARTQRIENASECDLHREALCSRDRHQFEMVWEYPRPVRDEVILRKRRVRVAARHHLGKIAMHDTDATGKVRHVRGEQCVGCRLSHQLVDSGTVPSASS